MSVGESAAEAPLLAVADAIAQVLDGAQVLGRERVALRAAAGRILAEDLVARRTQPPFPASAMDGYGIRATDVATLPARLRVAGVSAAGHGFADAVGPGEAVRLFTGAPVPEGADTIVLQEFTSADGDHVVVSRTDRPGRHIRAAGLDFREGDVLLRAGTRLFARELALAAAMNHAEVTVARQPRVAILATGDELVPPGGTPGRDQIVASNTIALASLVEAAGGAVIDLGIAADTVEALLAATRRAREADVLVTLGGASVGDHDLVQAALRREGMRLGFWKIAMRPGKPLIHGRLGAMRVLGLPGNPVSAIVCGLLFARPLVLALAGASSACADPSEGARLGADVAANDGRQDYVRAALALDEAGLAVATPLGLQDSSMLRRLGEAGCLVVRAPHAPAARAGDPVRIIRFDRLGL